MAEILLHGKKVRRVLPMPHAPKSRTEWAERKIEELLSLPFIAEFVFRSPKKLDTTEKEVADLLLGRVHTKSSYFGKMAIDGNQS